MLRWFLVLTVLVGTSVSMWGCTHTVRGAGADIQGAGQSMENYNRRTAADLD